jgi:hypothetical protein
LAEIDLNIFAGIVSLHGREAVIVKNESHKDGGIGING